MSTAPTPRPISGSLISRATLAGIGVDASEIFSNQFATAVTMPPSFVKDLHLQGLPIDSMARRFGTSVQAMELRPLRNLRLQ